VLRYYGGASPAIVDGARSTAKAAHLHHILIILVAVGLHGLDAREKGERKKKNKKKKKKRGEKNYPLTSGPHMSVGPTQRFVSSACHVCETAMQKQLTGLSEWFHKIGGVRFPVF
jgi:tRNA U54 and U55 pseudouridine synthase Pus10